MESKNDKEASKIGDVRNVKKSIEDGFYVVTDKLSTLNSGLMINTKDGIVVDRDIRKVSLKNNYESISYESIQLKVVNPKLLYEILKDHCKIYKRFIVIRVENRPVFAKLLWKGIINHQVCIGCEMLSNVNIGTNGIFNGKKLFDCKNKNGVLIPLNENMNTCEQENCVKHSKLNANEIIEDKNICCLATVESFPFTNTKINDKIPLNTKEISSGICKWIGLINGKQCVAITTKECYYDRFYKANGLISKLEEFENQLKKTIIVETKYIPSIINCESINCEVINPYSFGNIIVTNPIKYNKFINIKIKQHSELVKLLWKGKINERICLGCELFSDWTYGTTGLFKGKNLFECPDKRGVLIVMCNEIETCESKDHPDHKEIDKNDIINENICCIKLTSTENLKDKYLICTKNNKMKGLCKWTGLINGEKFVGILCNDNLICSNLKLFDKMQAIKNLTFVCTQDVEIEKLHFIQDKIVNLDKVTTVECVKFRTENKIIFDCSIIINLKLSDNNTKDFAGVVKWIGMINHKKCVGLDMEDEFEYGMDGTIDENNHFECMTRHGLITLLSNVKLFKDDDTLHYFDNGIINPNKIIKYIDRCNSDLHKDDIKIYDSVIVNLNNGDIKLSGTLRCCGLMNKSPVCVIELNEDHENGTDGKFWRSQLIKCPDKRAIAVNAKNIFKSVSDIDIVKRNLLEFYFTSNDVNLKCRTIKDLMKMEDKSILKSIISCPEHPIDLVIHHDLLQILINENEFEIVKLLLRNCINYNSYNDAFLNLSDIALSNDDDELFDLSINKCTNKNAIFENGETFLTNLFKKNCDENIINKIFDKKIFDTNITNKNNELPLILACERVMVSTVEKIVNNKTLYTHHKDLALSMVADAENKLSQLNRSMGDIIKIVRLLTKVPTNNSMECSICFDNDVSLVFQCGHFSCEKCVEQLFRCPFCDQEIKTTMRVYLT